MAAAFTRLLPLTQNLILGFFVLAICCAVYVVPNRFMGERSGIVLNTPLDALIPFSPLSVLGWVLALPAFLFPFFVIKMRKLLTQVIWGYLICAGIACAVFFAFPARVPRPGIPTQENFFYWSVALIYILDNPVSCMPAMSVTIITFATFCIWHLSRTMSLISIILTCVVTFSSLTLRQHFFADLIAGMTVAFAVYRLFIYSKINRALSSTALSDLINAPMVLRKLAYIYLALLSLGLLLFEAGLRFSPVLPTN